MDFITLALAKAYTNQKVQSSGTIDTSQFIKNPTNTGVGETLVVKTVDASGKPTAWETTEYPIEDINDIIKIVKHDHYFDITQSGVISLKADYRGVGKATYPDSIGNGTEAALPDKLIIPNEIDGIQVTTLAAGMFYKNTRVKEIAIPSTVTAIPESFAMYATNLEAIYDTQNITSIGKTAFAATRVKQAFFPNLTTMGTMVFASNGYLEIVDIGKVVEIPERTFADCAFLREVLGGENVVSIGDRAFYHTRSLRDLPLLAHVTSVADYAFFFSRICTALPAGGGIGTKAFPTVDNTTDFWTGVPYIPCQNRLTTKLSQANPAWKSDTILTDTNTVTYNGGCFFFAVMHIHSAITGKYYSDPRDFAEELKADANLAKFLTTAHWAGEFQNVSAMFEALGYTTEVHGLAQGDDLTEADYKAMVDALAAGAYVYAQVGLYNRWQNNDFDTGHAVVIYGINEYGEVRVLDSAIRHEGYRADGFEPDADIYTYAMPYQNMVGPSSNFVIVYPPNVEPSTEDTGDYIPVPATAQVGQTVVVKAVDENGKPTQWEAVDMPEGGGNDEWKLVSDVTSTEAASLVSATANDGLNDLLAYVLIPKIETDTGGTIYLNLVLQKNDGTTATSLVALPQKPTTNDTRYIIRADALGVGDVQIWSGSSASGGTKASAKEEDNLKVRDVFVNGGKLLGIQVFWNVNNTLPVGIHIQLWGR